MSHAQADEAALLNQARAGDAGIRLHCYRMLGSFHDAEDVTQEVLVRAWRHLGSFDGRSSLRTWLYRIATNRCLTSRARRFPEAPAGAAFAPPLPNAPEVEVADLQPFPDADLGGLAPQEPGAVYDLRESVSLAFLTVIQLLPARQRAVLLLRDVLGFSAAETAQLLETTVAGANSALQRARAALEPHRASGRRGRHRLRDHCLDRRRRSHHRDHRLRRPGARPGLRPPGPPGGMTWLTTKPSPPGSARSSAASTARSPSARCSAGWRLCSTATCSPGSSATN